VSVSARAGHSGQVVRPRRRDTDSRPGESATESQPILYQNAGA